MAKPPARVRGTANCPGAGHEVATDRGSQIGNVDVSGSEKSGTDAFFRNHVVQSIDFWCNKSWDDRYGLVKGVGVVKCNDDRTVPACGSPIISRH